MKKIAIISLIFSGVFAVYFGAKVSADEKEKELVRIPLENYLKGHETGKAEFMQKAFHTEGNLIFVRDGKYTTRSFKDYIAGMSGEPAKDEAQRKRKIESIDISGNAAVGKIVLDYPTVRFVDFMSLLKIDGEWKIINKTFYAEPKNAGSTAVAPSGETEENAVRQAALDYVESVYNVNPAQVEQSVHPELVKRGFSVKKGETAYSPSSMTFAQLVELSKNYNKKGGIPKDAIKEVAVFDVADQTASAKVTAVWGIDYMHLAKYDGKWKIINILWQSPPKKR